jgi:hypothetical protein
MYKFKNIESFQPNFKKEKRHRIIERSEPTQLWKIQVFKKKNLDTIKKMKAYKK